jgi:hypothetical protein
MLLLSVRELLESIEQINTVFVASLSLFGGAIAVLWHSRSCQTTCAANV